MPPIDAIPETLRSLRQWVCWRYVKRGDDKPTKVPFQIDGTPAKSTDPQTWNTLGAVIGAAGFDGIGFVFSESDGLIGVDLDNSIDESGALKPWASAMVNRFNTYTEVSPSKRGVKLWCRGEYPSVGTGKRRPYKDGAIEMYHKGRYFTVTGDRYNGTPAEIAERQDCVNGLFHKILAPKPEPASKPRPSATDRCVKYIQQGPDAVSGQGGHDRTFHIACICYRFGLSHPEARRVMDWANSTKCAPPWTDQEIEHKLSDALVTVTAAGEFGKWAGGVEETPRIKITSPPERSGLLERLDGAITGKRTNIAWPWPVLTAMARALVPGTVTVLCGMGGSSKSLMVSEACLHWLANNVPFAVFHLEEDREFHELRALAQLGHKAPLTEDEWQHDNPDETLDAYARHGDTVVSLGKRIWDAPGSDVSLADLETWVRDRAADGCRVIVVDPVTAANSGSEPWIADRRFVLNSKRLMRESGASLLVVTHPRDGNTKNGNRMDNHAGGQAYNRFTSCVLSLSSCKPRWRSTVEYTPAGTVRDQQQVNRLLSLHKTRSARGAGHDVGYWFDANSLRFTECGVLCDD